jgi:hypothetical protein
MPVEMQPPPGFKVETASARPPTLAVRLARIALSSLLVAGIAGCATTPSELSPSATAETAACLDAFQVSERAITRAGRADVEARRIPGIPFLRVNRLLAAFVGEATTVVQKRAWLARAAALDKRGRNAEHANLENPLAPALDLQIAQCRDALQSVYADDPTTWQQIKSGAAPIADNYATWKRVLGLYPLSAQPVLAGVKRLHRTAAVVAITAHDASGFGYTYPELRARNVSATSRDALGIPVLDDLHVSTLLQRHAPDFRIADDRLDDRIGRVVAARPGEFRVDPNQPTVYTATSFTRFGDATLIQLIYSIWFPARPREQRFDLLGGHLDAITWRVTLDLDGTPLIYDAMHNCGCYHMFFPGARLRRRSQVNEFAEPLWVPLEIPAAWPDRLSVRIASGTHYISAVGPREAAADAQQPLKVEQLDSLRSIATGAGHNVSLYDDTGLVRSSQRLERFLLWPMGVQSPGAMRQWGHHATAFVGRRHFDEARLIDRYFERR